MLSISTSLSNDSILKGISPPLNEKTLCSGRPVNVFPLLNSTVAKRRARERWAATILRFPKGVQTQSPLHKDFIGFLPFGVVTKVPPTKHTLSKISGLFPSFFRIVSFEGNISFPRDPDFSKGGTDNMSVWNSSLSGIDTPPSANH